MRLVSNPPPDLFPRLLLLHRPAPSSTPELSIFCVASSFILGNISVHGRRHHQIPGCPCRPVPWGLGLLT
uniref:Uncharacterized protein n=1 Tax=Triticum urartu TaxID=4572 RepID=A0A8R7JWM1_TRIUA